MYQESAHEMRRLLRSLKKLSNSKSIPERHIHIESHIFLDNGADGKDVKEFGIQLLSLVEETFMMKEQYGIMIHTPYGIKLSWTVPGEMPLFLHLKDNSLVKGKKRWSQVMYMRYILNYRANVHKMYRKSSGPLNSMRNDSCEFVNVGISINEQTIPTKQDMAEPDVPTVTFESSSKASSFSDLTTVTNLEEGETKATDHHIVDFDSSKENKSEITLRVPRLHLKSKNRRSSFDHSFISLDNLQDRNDINGFSYAFDAETQNRDLPYNFTGAKFRSSSFNDLEFEYHKYTAGELSQEYNCSVEDEKYQDFILATDADMSFDDHNVLNLLDTIEKDAKIGGVCGRTLPIGIHQHPVVWLQMFDYAKGTCTCSFAVIKVMIELLKYRGNTTQLTLCLQSKT
jgi:chitin synthase